MCFFNIGGQILLIIMSSEETFGAVFVEALSVKEFIAPAPLAPPLNWPNIIHAYSLIHASQGACVCIITQHFSEQRNRLIDNRC